jgi:predicted nucleic acid-binding Zn finger protein
VNYAQSWGSVLREGFNESIVGHLKNYIINGSTCTSSEIGGNVTERDISECNAEYGAAPYLHIHYGPSFAVFYKSHAEIFVDETSYPSCFMEINTGEEENQTINQTVGNETNST